jgi:hypothetical protein
VLWVFGMKAHQVRVTAHVFLTQHTKLELLEHL